MARLPTLIARLAATDGRDAAGLAWVARVAREGGLLSSTGKRGVGAAEVTARDAATLLIAANVAETTREALLRTQTVRAFVPESLPFREEREETGVLGEITRAETFGDALERAIDSAAELSALMAAHLRKRFADEPNAALRKHASGMGFVGFDVRFETCGGAPTAATMCLWQRAGLSRRDERVWTFQGDAELIESGYYVRQSAFDRYGATTVGLKTLVHLWLAVHGPEGETAGSLAELGIALEGAGA